MGWADLFSFLGGAASGASNVLTEKAKYDQEEEKSQQDSQLKLLQEEIKKDLALIAANSRESVAQTNAGARTESANISAGAQRDVAGTNAGARVESANIGAGAQRDVANTNAQSRETVANTQGATARDVAGTRARAEVQSAEIGADASVLNNNNRVGESSRQFDMKLPLLEFGADTDRINAQRPRANTNFFMLPGTPGAATTGAPATPGAGVTAPSFGPSYNDFLQHRRGGYGPNGQPAAAPPQGTPPPPGTEMGQPDVVPAAGQPAAKPSAPVAPRPQAAADPRATMSAQIAQAIAAVSAAKTPAAREQAMATLAKLRLAAEQLRQQASK